LNRTLIIFGILLVAAGIAWPYFLKAVHAIWGLPGNFAFHKGGFHLYFPLTLCLILSIIFSIIVMIVRR
jgi:hypothetical protein